MEFKALRVPALTSEVAGNLRTILQHLPGVKELKINLESQELYVEFDENQLGFRALVQEMDKAGCSLRNIDAALLL